MEGYCQGDFNGSYQVQGLRAWFRIRDLGVWIYGFRVSLNPKP